MPDTRLPIREEYRITWEQYQRGRFLRRTIGELVAPPVIRRKVSKDDPHLRAAFEGERGPRFPTNAELKEIFG